MTPTDPDPGPGPEHDDDEPDAAEHAQALAELVAEFEKGGANVGMKLYTDDERAAIAVAAAARGRPSEPQLTAADRARLLAARTRAGFRRGAGG